MLGSERGTSEVASTTVVELIETFNSHICAGNVNPSTREGLKLYLKVIKEFPKDEKCAIYIENPVLSRIVWIFLVAIFIGNSFSTKHLAILAQYVLSFVITMGLT